MLSENETHKNADKQILRDGVEMAKRLQEMEEHLYACRYLGTSN